jgi:histidine triad (HIT) family protein
MTDCLFCKIVEGKITAEIVFEDDKALAFRDIHPAAPTHALVIPRRHIATIDDMQSTDELDMGHLFWVAAQVARKDGLGERGYRVAMNCKADGGQSVFHVHLHVLGGKPMGWPPFP